jgi:hypothetical protein
MRPRFTAYDLPPGWMPLKGGLQAWPPYGRPASLDGVFVAGFYDDETLEFYAYLQEGLVADGCALKLKRGREKGWASVDGVTDYYENGVFYSVANGHEEGDPESRACPFEVWVRDKLAAIGRSATMARRRDKRRREGRPLWQTPDGRFIDE